MEHGLSADSFDGSERELAVLIGRHPLAVGEDELELERGGARVEDEDVHGAGSRG
jgi:hypothetical protein